mmetsp:Transcript_9084/g.12117  ORF Transcript_9084/g.12117 Transcript_9084/m.12117 type:complete len:92 (+) Transcript_9084:1115-1390(+)
MANDLEECLAKAMVVVVVVANAVVVMGNVTKKRRERLEKVHIFSCFVIGKKERGFDDRWISRGGLLSFPLFALLTHNGTRKRGQNQSQSCV